MASSRVLLVSFLFSFCLLSAVLSMPYHLEEEATGNELEDGSKVGFEEVPEEEELVPKIKGPDDEEEIKDDVDELEEGKDEDKEEEELEADKEEEELEADKKEEELETVYKEEDELEAEEAIKEEKEDELDKKDIDSPEEGILKEDEETFFDTEEKKEMPDEDIFKKDEVIDSEEAGEEVGGFDHEEVEKPGFIRKMYKKVKDFFKGIGK